MKNIFLIIGLVVSINVVAQTRRSEKIENKNGLMTITIEEEKNGNKKVFERSYAVQGLSDNQKDALVEKLRDSLSTKGFQKLDSKRKSNKDSDNEDISITISPDGSQSESYGISPEGENQTNKRYKNKKNGRSIDIDVERFAEDFGRDMERFGERMSRQFERDGKRIERRLEQKRNQGDRNDEGFGSNKNDKTYNLNFGNGSNTIQRLRAYPNNPFNNVLNVSFEAPEKGDVTITVSDVSGKQVAQEKVKDFEGNYVGQVSLKNVEKGTLFINVTQGKDGATKRVIID